MIWKEFWDLESIDAFQGIGRRCVGLRGWVVKKDKFILINYAINKKRKKTLTQAIAFLMVF